MKTQFPEWNKISEDNLPEDGQTCFVHVKFEKSGYVMIETYFVTEEQEWLEDYTHWMPCEFPEPPKK